MALGTRQQPRLVKMSVRHFFTLPPHVSLLMSDGTNRYYSDLMCDDCKLKACATCIPAPLNKIKNSAAQ